MRYPSFLKENQTIGFVAPSFGCATEPYKTAFEHALKNWKKAGYGLDLGPNCFVEKGIGISNDPKLCAEELMESYLSDKNDAIISCGGGELMCEVVPHLDFAKLKEAKPKWYMGFSDNTNFTFLSTILMDTAAVYGPCASAFGMEPWHTSIGDAWDLFCGKIHKVSNYDLWEKEWTKCEERPLDPYNVTEPVYMRAYIPAVAEGVSASGDKENAEGILYQDSLGTCYRLENAPDTHIELEGRLLGGCMDILQMYPGTRYDKVEEFAEKYKEDGIIWFLEACDLNIMSIRRCLWQLREAGWFKYLKGFLIGRPLCMGEEAFGIDQYRAVTDVLGEYGLPIIMDTDIGHYSPMMPIVSGSTAKVSLKGNQLEIQFTYM